MFSTTSGSVLTEEKHVFLLSGMKIPDVRGTTAEPDVDLVVVLALGVKMLTIGWDTGGQDNWIVFKKSC